MSPILSPENRFMTAPEARSRLYADRGREALPVSVMTVRNRIRADGFKSRVPAKNTELTQRHRDTHLSFSRAYVGWNNAEWR